MATTISNRAYCKLMLHIIKHTTNDCYGILLGTKPTEDSYSIDDSVPFSHDKLFAPSLEVAMKLIEVYSEIPLVIIGAYENLMQNQMRSDQSMYSEQSSHLCDLIHSKVTPFPIMLQISSRDVTNDAGIIDDEINVRMMKYNGKGDFVFTGIYNESQSQFDSMKNYLSGCVQNDIVDFDDHFLDANLDWRNLFIK